MATLLLGARPARAADPDPTPAAGLDVRSTTRSDRSTPPPPWYEAPEFRALAEVRRAFMNGGSSPVAAIRTPEGGARQAALWTLYELHHVLEELAHRTRSGAPGWCVVRAGEHGPGRVILDIAVQPIPDDPLAERGAP